jgi:hypothetical protein
LKLLTCKSSRFSKLFGRRCLIDVGKEGRGIVG